MSHCFVVRFAVMSCLFALVDAQGEVDARSPVSKGATAWLVYESTIDAVAEFGGREITTNERVAWTLHMAVTDLDADGNYLVTTKVVRVRGKLVLAMAQGEATFDSAGEEDGTASPTAQHAAKGITEVAGKSFRCKVSPRGQLLELGEGKEGMLLDGPRAGSMHLRDEALLRQWVESAFGIVPEKRTAGGAQWKRSVGESFGRMPTRQQLTSMLTVVDPDHFEIESAGTVELDLVAAKELAKKDRAHVIGQIERTKVTSSKVESKQKTSRRDGFVLASSRTIALEFTSEDPSTGQISAKYTLTTTTTRTTEAEALQKADGAKGEVKPPADAKGK